MQKGYLVPWAGLRTDRRWRRAAGLVFVLVAAGCESPRPAVKYPDDALRVRYEEATTYSTCLVASAAMAANYMLDKYRFSENGIREALKQSGRDETLVRDLRDYLAEQGLRMFVLRGRLDETPPTGLVYWVRTRRYPVICVINRDAVDPAFNHAVVVIGISRNPQDPSADIIHYFDPSVPAPLPLHSEPADAFEVLWARGQYAMMIVAVPVAAESASSAGPFEETR
jgi:hypothetical protein